MKRILVIRYKKSVGDTIIGTALCESLKKKYPDSQVDYLVYENLTKLFYNHRSIDNVLTLDRKAGIKGWFETLKKIRKNKYDIVVDCRTIFVTAIFSFLSGAKQRIGKYHKYLQYFYTDSIGGFKGKENQIDQIVKYHRLLKPLDINEVNTEYVICLKEEEKIEWRNRMEAEGIDMSKLIIPMAVNARQSNKKYPEEYMLKIAQTLIDRYDAQIILFYSPNEEAYAREFYAKLNSNRNVFINLKTKNVRELACIFSNCDLFVGNEGGTRHVAEGVGLANLCIVAPQTSKEEWISNENSKNQCVTIQDVNGKNYEDIKPEYVLERIDKQLQLFNFFNKKNR